MKHLISVSSGLFFVVIVFSFSLKAQEYQWVERAPMPTPRCGMLSAVHDGKIYVIGGMVSKVDTALSVVEVYDPVNDTWETRADAPFRYSGAGTVTLNGKIYVFGGINAWTGEQYNTIYNYDPNTDTWELIGEYPFPLISNWGMAGTRLGEEFYSIGGSINGTAHPFNISYHPGFGDWDEHAQVIPGRWGAKAVTVDNKIYLAGGTDPPAIFSNFEVFDPVEDKWTKLSPIPEPRMYHNAVYHNSQIYVMPAAKSWPVGGVVSDSMFIYNIAADTWSSHYNPLPGNVTICEVHTALDENNEEAIFVIGGATLDWWQDTGGPKITNAVWKLEEGTVSASHVDPDESLALMVNPNPVSDNLYLRYHIPSQANIRLSLNDLEGRQILMVTDEITARGDHVVELDTRDLVPGTYFCSLLWKDRVVTRKIVKVR